LNYRERTDGVEAMKDGATDFLSKPLDHVHLLTAIRAMYKNTVKRLYSSPTPISTGLTNNLS
jgi:FixJ family two-component response regulator